MGQMIFMINPQSSHLDSVHTLRGLASLWVCVFHFTKPDQITWSPLKAIGEYGWLGVEIFFIISGFILPYVLYRSNYSISKFKGFLLKRLVRLEPPYLMAIILVIILNYASALAPGFRGIPFALDFEKLLLHLGYLIAFFDYDWFNPVFWTLAIELQFYLILGLVFPFVANKSYIKSLFFILFCIMAYLIPSGKFFFHYFFLFFVGFITFEFFVGKRHLSSYVFLLIIGFAGVVFTVGCPAALAGIFAVLYIIFFKIKNRFLTFLGTISYSLYLIHVPIGVRLIHISDRFELNIYSQSLVIIMALIISIIFAHFMFIYVEEPFQKLASKIKYNDECMTPPLGLLSLLKKISLALNIKKS